MKQEFRFNDESRPTLEVLGQLTYKYDAMTIQISKVKAEDEVKFVYEEITNDTDEVTYARYMGESNIRRNYPWAVTLLPLVKLTGKQAEVLRCVKNYSEDFEGDIIWVDDFCEDALKFIGAKRKVVEGILSSLWVKGYITMSMHGDKKYFEVDHFGIEYLKDAQAIEEPVAIEEEEEEDTEE
jgi:hypothetical protein